MRTAAMLSATLFAVALFAGSPERAQAQVSVAPFIGYNLDAEELHIGSSVQFALPAKIGRSQLIASPSFDFYPFIDNGSVGGGDYSASLYMLSFDVLYPVPTAGALSPYVGAGLAMIHASVSYDNPSFPSQSFDLSDTDLGLNLKGGAFFATGRARPFAEAVVVLSNGSTLLLRGGMKFQLGK